MHKNPVMVNGIKIYPFASEENLLQYLDNYLGILVAINAEKILHATNNSLKEIINNNLGYCDGIGATKALQRKGYKNIPKTPGCELWLKIISKYYKSKTFGLIGGEDNTISQVITTLQDDFKGIDIVYARNGFFSFETEKDSLIRTLKSVNPDIIFVAMGSPKQELLMNELLKHHSALYMGLGGSFDVYIGKVNRAPRWFVKHNMEGPYRVFKQPDKIKRFIKVLPFWYNVLLNKY